MEPTIRYIGKIQSELKNIEDCPRQENESAPEATITIFPEYIEGMRHVEVGSEILLLTWLHLSDRSVLKTKPRNNPKAQLTGIFSTRSPDHPNPIGLHTVKVISVDDGKMKVSALEVLDGTPLIDIKPVI
jgi:tRNA-Thr(GGU) m(6)t(6)A37 methyltransferase TsaA